MSKNISFTLAITSIRIQSKKSSDDDDEFMFVCYMYVFTSTEMFPKFLKKELLVKISGSKVNSGLLRTAVDVLLNLCK